MTHALTGRGRGALGALLLAALAGGCNDPITGNVQRQGLPGLDFNLDPAASRGAATGVAKASYNVSVDASTPVGLSFVPNAVTGNSSRYGGCPGLSSTATRCWGFGPTVRDSARDPRKPFLKTLPRTFVVQFCSIGGPEYFGATAQVQAFEIFCRFDGAEPGAVYSLALVRYMTLVRGENDWVERARTGGLVTDPDTLIVMNSLPGGAPAVDYNWTSNLACNFLQPPAGANPFYLGNATATAAGRVSFDKCFGSSAIFYRNAATSVADSAPVFRNSLGGGNIEQQYNYLEVREGSTPGGRPVVRIQLGADIIYNCGVNRVLFAVSPLEPLGGVAAYRIVLVDRGAGTATPISARYRAIRTDTTGRTPEGAYIIRADTSTPAVVQSVKGGAANVTHLIEVDPTLLPGNVTLTNFTDVALQPPSATKGVPIWAQFVLQKGSTPTDTRFQDVATVQFGTLPLTPNATPYVFRAAGSASGTNRGDQLGIAFSRLPRPPIGFFYNVWLLPADPNGAPVSAGPLRTPLPELGSLEMADTAAVGGIFTPNLILDANLLLRPADVAALPAVGGATSPTDKLRAYSRVRLTLEAKDGVPEMSSVIVLEGPLVTPGS